MSVAAANDNDAFTIPCGYIRSADQYLNKNGKYYSDFSKRYEELELES